MTRRFVIAIALALAAAVSVGQSLAAPDRKPPRILAAALQDADGDGRPDRVRLRYSERIRHAADRDRRYPFTVSGYRIRSVGRASGKTLVIVVREKAGGDRTPVIRYRRTKAKPVRDRRGNQAVAQVFRSTSGPGGQAPLPPESPPPPPPNPNLPVDDDPDRDGYAAPEDCRPSDATIHPGAADLPELAFVDSNCDGIDGTEANAVFASPLGNDANPGTKAAPKRQIQAAITAAAATKRYVLAAGGLYGGVSLASDVSVYGGYEPAGWSRSMSQITQINGRPQAVLADQTTGVVLQLLNVRGLYGGPGERSAYGIRAINGASLRLERVVVTTGDGLPGTPGASGKHGLDGKRGGGVSFAGPYCDWTDSDTSDTLGGGRGDSPVGRLGGRGGHGGSGADGQAGEDGRFGTPGGPGGPAGDPGKAGGNGHDGTSGLPGIAGAGGPNSSAGAGASWTGVGGGPGRFGDAGNGGGGGGGGGAAPNFS